MLQYNAINNQFNQIKNALILKVYTLTLLFSLYKVQTLILINNYQMQEMRIKGSQRLYSSLSKPLAYLGMTLDEWAVLFVGFVPGIFLVAHELFSLGLVLMAVGFMMCYILKTIKNLTKFFLVKSWLLSKDLISPPSKQYPHMLRKVVGK